MSPLQTAYHAEAKAVYLINAGIVLGADSTCAYFTCAYESFTLVSRLRVMLTDNHGLDILSDEGATQHHFSYHGDYLVEWKHEPAEAQES